MQRSAFRFHFTKRVRYAEVDPQAVLFNSRHFEYFDIGTVEYWRAVGLYEHTSVAGGVEFHIARALVEYRRPILLDEEIDICVAATAIGRSSLTMAFALHGAGRDDLRATGEEVQVHVAEARGAPAPIPDWIRALFTTYEGRELGRPG